MNNASRKPVIIFRFIAHEGAGYLGDFLSAKNIAWQLHEIDQNKPLPESILAYSGVVLMGGSMSVNDDLPWIAPMLDLIREAFDNNIALLGHCLGGQLMSKALGGVVVKNNNKEIGWGNVTISSNEIATKWFGEIETFTSFHWHGETFSLPLGAKHLLASANCQNQAWAIDQHLALQCHIEMTVEMVKKWCEEGNSELHEFANSPAVQQAGEMQQNLILRCNALNKIADQVYSCWIKGLKTY